ncbi:MAG: ABC transporter permease [Acidobacteriia bacterium]|nr:ABC transporter permease [Terriglobia bacterium]
MQLPHLLDTLGQDLRYALRNLKNTPAFATVAILSLALGIGANTAIFSIVDAVMLKDLPVERPLELLQVKIGRNDSFTNPLWEQLRDHQDVFSGVFAWGARQFNLASGGEVRYANGVLASGDFFRALGVRAILGRTFTPADDRRGCAALAVLSYDFWQSRYGGDGKVIGRTLSLDGHPFEIVGVVQPGFYGVDIGRNSQIAVPICVEPVLNATFGSMLDQRSSWWLRVIGRPKLGLGAKQVTSRLKTLAPQIFQATVPPNWGGDDQQQYLHNSFETAPAANGLSYFRTEYSVALAILTVVVGAVLLIACANIANLLLARASSRQKEVAVRLAMGASRGRLIRQFLTESVVLSLIGAALGIVLANWGAALLVRYVSKQNEQIFLDVATNLRVIGFTVAVALATGILFGVAPAWRGTRIPLNAAMKENARGLAGSRLRLGKTLVISQVALSLVLLIGAGLLVTTFRKLMAVDAGFNRENVLLVHVEPGNSKIPKDRLGVVYDQILENVRSLPGVRSASRSVMTPISGGFWNEEVQADSFSPKSREDSIVYFNRVTPMFFQTLDTPILAGRDFSVHDTKGSPLVAIINQAMARKFFAGINPIGKFYHEAMKPGVVISTLVVGLVKDAKYGELRETTLPTAYIPMSQDEDPWGSNIFEIRTAGGATTLISPVKAAFEQTNRYLNLEFNTLALQVNESLNRERLLASLSGFFGLLALLLAAIGLYGVMSYNVVRRRSEIGIRLALGAEQKTILWMVLREVLLLVAGGMAVGFLAAAASTRLIRGMLYEISPSDPGTLALAGTILLAVALLAGYLPARRAARLDPMSTLREE